MSVSVIIPFYNAKEYLGRAIDSCLIQDEVSQIILVDDGSTDEGLEIASSYDGQHHNIKLFKHEQNQGRSAARNTGLSAINQEFVTFLDADDYFLSNRFKNAIHCLQLNPEVGGTYETVRSEFTSDGIREMGKVDELTGIQEFVDPNKLFEYLILGQGGHISLIGCLFRNRVIKDIRFDTTLEVGEDTDYLWRISRKLRLLKASDEQWIVRTIHGKNSYFAEKLVIENKAVLYKKWLDRCVKYQLPSKVTRKIFRSFLHYSKLSGEGKQFYKLRLFLVLKTLFKQPKTLFRIL